MIASALSAEDRIPHTTAVWRDASDRPPESEGSRPISVDYGGGAIICTLVCQADWEAAKRWRWGWPAA